MDWSHFEFGRFHCWFEGYRDKKCKVQQQTVQNLAEWLDVYTGDRAFFVIIAASSQRVKALLHFRCDCLQEKLPFCLGAVPCDLRQKFINKTIIHAIPRKQYDLNLRYVWLTITLSTITMCF